MVSELRDHPDLALVFGFHPLKLSQVENFSAFLGDLVEATRPAHMVDSQAIISQLKWAKERFSLDICAVIADSGIDSVKVLSFIIQEPKASPISPAT